MGEQASARESGAVAKRAKGGERKARREGMGRVNVSGEGGGRKERNEGKCQ